ncbi:MAG: serine/threonine protein kinase [Myxococcales bacterium]|nr:serine/threonine protein kinase [Myxococcales bacterium]
MNNKLNCSDERLWSLLQLDDDSDEFRQLATHVENCTRCQSRLEELAAEPKEWSVVRDSLHCGSDIELPDDEAERRPWRHPRSMQSAAWTESMARQLLSPPTHPEMLGRIGRYEVERLIGSGGMGVVFKAFDTELNRPVAVKALAPHLAGSGAARNRFAREARAAAAVVHDHVVAIHNVESEGASPFLVMPYVAGESLQQRIDREGSLELCEILRIVKQTAAGLAAAHAQGLVHRDVKPSNLLYTDDGTVKVVDLGLATVSAPEGEGRRTWVDELVGSLDYMAPEQANHPDEADARSDLYALGCTLYFLLEGRAPFADRLALKKLMAHAVEPPPPLTREVPAGLRAILDRLLAKDPNDRFESAEALIAALDAWDDPAPASASAPTPPAGVPAAPAPPSKPSRASLFVVVGLSALLLVAIGAGVSIRFLRQPTLSVVHPIAGELASGDATRPKERSLFDAHVVGVEVGRTYLFTMRSQELDPMLVLRADGWELEQCDDAPGHGLTAQIVWRADHDPVEIVATTPIEGATGHYVLTVEELAMPRLALEEPVDGSLVDGDARYDDGSLLDRYWLRVEAGETYVIEMRGTGFAPFLYLENDERRMLASAHADGDEPLVARLVYVADRTGAVFVGANAERPGEGGAYRLSVASELAGEEVLRQTGILGEGDPTLGDDSWYDVFHLPMEAGRTYVITMRSEEFDTYLLLVDPNDVRVQQNDDAIGTDSRIVYRPTETRVMRIFANSYTAGMSGQYTVSVRELRQ